MWVFVHVGSKRLQLKWGRRYTVSLTKIEGFDFDPHRAYRAADSDTSAVNCRKRYWLREAGKF
jgi:hypothetical protein